MSDYYSKSPDQEAEVTLAQLVATGIFWFGKTGETDPNNYNRRLQLATLRDWLIANLSVSASVTAGADEKAVTWPVAYAVTPTGRAPRASFYSSTGADAPVLCSIKPGSISTTGCTVVFSHTLHSGGVVTVDLPG